MTEYVIQKKCIAWIRATHPDILVTATVGGVRLTSGPAGAAKLKASGYLNGIPDILIFEPRNDKHGLFIEMKAPGKKPSDDQIKIIDTLKTKGYEVSVENSEEGFKETVTRYLSNQTE